MTDETFLRNAMRAIDPPALPYWTAGYSLEVGDKILVDWPRSRWAILWDRIRHPLTEPKRREKRLAEVVATGDKRHAECVGKSDEQ